MAEMWTATKSDIPHIVEMGRRFHAHVSPRWPLDGDKLADVLAELIETQFVAVTSGGFIAGVCSQHPISDWTVAKEFLWWAEDGSGAKLRAAFREWAQLKRADEIQWSCPPGAKAERLYRRTAQQTEIIYSEFCHVY